MLMIFQSYIVAKYVSVDYVSPKMTIKLINLYIKNALTMYHYLFSGQRSSLVVERSLPPGFDSWPNILNW